MRLHWRRLKLHILGQVVLVLLAGCTGGLHRQGQQQLGVTGSWGHPISGEVIWPDGAGRAENEGATLSYSYYPSDRWAVMVAGSPYRRYVQTDGDVYAGELEVGVRYHFWEFDIADVPVGLHVEALGGLMTGSRSIPENGAMTNFTQSTGIGFEVHLDKHLSWLGGYRLRHLSHGHVWTGGENPSQNDHHIYTGLAFTW